MPDILADQPTAAALAAAAGVAELAAAAEADGPEGDGLLAMLVRHEVALGHRLTMQFAAAGNAALDVALAQLADEAAAKAADRQAARLGGVAARVMGNVRLAVRALGGLPATAADEGEWIGVRFEDEPACSPAEAEKRLAAARAAAWNRQEAAPAVAAPPADAAAQDPAAAALAAAAGLAAEAGVAELAAGATLTGLLRHELAAAHRLAMRCGGRACRLLAEAQPADDQTEALRLASASARLMARGRQALAMLPQFDPAPAGGPAGGPRRVAGYYWLGEHDLLEHRPTDHAQAPRESVVPAAAASPAVLANRGRLRNGNPSGDYLAAPRCGARTRAGCACRQPAMANGRCRFHGGKSTGPRTATGLARSRAARRTHGGYSAEIIDLRARPPPPTPAGSPRCGRSSARQRAENGRQKAARADKPAPPAALIVPAAAAFGRRPSAPRSPVLAGHGVHPLFFMRRAPSRERAEAPPGRVDEQCNARRCNMTW